MSNEDLIRKWLDGSLSEEERKVFETSDDFSAIRKLDRSIQSFKASEYVVEAELDRLNARKQGKGKSVRMQWLNPVLKVAAVVLVIISTSFFFYLNRETTVRTNLAETTRFFLPDSSLVILNAGSTASYKEMLWGFNREVQLEGEAFFSVAKGSKFEVVTSNGLVSVLGTEFNVKSRKDFFEVVCYEGLVQVESQGEKSKLSVGHSFRIYDNHFETNDKIRVNAPAWIEGKSTFISVPLSEVFDEFERQYKVSINAERINTDQLFTGTFLHNDMEQALKAITSPLGVTYEIKQDGLINLKPAGD